jgi:hypothetical protein
MAGRIGADGRRVRAGGAAIGAAEGERAENGDDPQRCQNADAPAWTTGGRRIVADGRGSETHRYVTNDHRDLQIRPRNQNQRGSHFELR